MASLPPQALPRNLSPCERARPLTAATRKGARRLAAIRTLAQHRDATIVTTDRQVRVGCLIRQEFIADEAVLDDRQQFERQSRGKGVVGCSRSKSVRE